MDERQQNVVQSAMAKVLVIVYIAVVLFGVMKFCQHFQIIDCLFELIVAVAVPILVLLFMRSRKKASFPMSLAGLAILPDRTHEAKRGRMKAYAWESLQYGMTLTVLFALMEGWSAFRTGGLTMPDFHGVWQWGLQMAGQFALYFAVCFAINYVVYEQASRRYCRQHGEDE